VEKMIEIMRNCHENCSEDKEIDMNREIMRLILTKSSESEECLCRNGN
jgi:hypothetical protein